MEDRLRLVSMRTAMTKTAEPIKGYRALSDAQIALGNAFKEIEEGLLRLTDLARKCPDMDQRFLSIAITHFQEGFMSLGRANFQPQRIQTDIDVTKAFSVAQDLLTPTITMVEPERGA